MNLTETNRRWLDQRFSRNADGSYFGHEPIYGLEGRQFSESNPIIRYARIFQVLRFLNRMVPIGTLLDVGGGEGYVAHLASKFFGARVVNFDLSSEASQRARELFNLDGVAGVAHQLPFASRSFDVVLCLEVIEHLEMPIHSLLELSRICSRHIIVSSENFSLSTEERNRRVASRRIQFHFDRNCFVRHDLEVLFGTECLMSVDQHIALEPAQFSKISNSVQAHEFILQCCPVREPQTDAQIHVKCKAGSLAEQGQFTDEALLEMMLDESVQPGRIYFQSPDTLAPSLVNVLVCPDCAMLLGDEVALSPTSEKGQLICKNSSHTYSIEQGVPLLYPIGSPTLLPLEDVLKREGFAAPSLAYILGVEKLLQVPETEPHIEGCLDEPCSNCTVFGTIQVKGWAIDLRHGSRLRVDIALDGVFIGSTYNDIPAQDVRDYWERLGLSAPLTSRFIFQLDSARLTNGFHNLRVLAKPASGNPVEICETTFQVAKERCF